MSCANVSITVLIVTKLRLAVPAEVNVTRSAFHVHAASVLLDPDSALRAFAPVVGIFIHPSQHPGPIFAVLLKHAAQKTGMRGCIARRAHHYSAFPAVKFLAISARGCSPVDHLAVGG